MKVVHETWESFWGPLLLLRFHEGDPRRWSLREERARWLWELLGLAPAARVADLGCGDGVLTTCLARLGARATGVDRLASVLRHARTEAGDVDVEFRECDLREASFPGESLDAAVLLEVSGLLEEEAEASLLERVRGWLRPGGRVAIDCPVEPAEPGFSWRREFSDGLLEASGSYDPATRRQSIELTFTRTDGTVLELVDPYDASAGAHSGVRRRIHDPGQLAALLEQAGFAAERVDEPSRPTHHLLLATAR